MKSVIYPIRTYWNFFSFISFNVFFIRSQGFEQQGQNIALSGNTGIGTGPHLHFGVKKNGKSDNPEKYLPGF